METSAFLFPGQGSQTIGMGKALFDAFPIAKAVFEEVDEALGQKLSYIMFSGEESDLTLTSNAQPALMAHSIAVIRVLEQEKSLNLSKYASYVAGHSLGEYSALCATGAFSLFDTAKLLRIRGDAMQKAVPVGEGAMAALLGVELEIAQEIAKEAESQTGEICDVANDNGGGQVVISGTKKAVDLACSLSKEKGVKRAILLPVSAPFHSRLMMPAAKVMQEALADVKIAKPCVPVVVNVLARPVDDPEAIRKHLVEQVTASVRWRESMLWLGEQGITRFFECGSGKVLTGIAKRLVSNAKAENFGTPEEIALFSC